MTIDELAERAPLAMRGRACVIGSDGNPVYTLGALRQRIVAAINAYAALKAENDNLRAMLEKLNQHKAFKCDYCGGFFDTDVEMEGDCKDDRVCFTCGDMYGERQDEARAKVKP